MRLSYLFWRCITVDYTHLAEGLDYATERVGSTLYLYLESSCGSEDWLQNLDFPSAAYLRDGKTAFYAHRGFLRAFRTLEPILAGLAARPPAVLRIVGYSHGGALTVLSHEYVYYRFPHLRPRLFSYAFATPRVLFGPNRAEMKERFLQLTCVRNSGDIVTHLPPALLGYYHVGRMVTVGKSGRYSPFSAHKKENILRELRLAGL